MTNNFACQSKNFILNNSCFSYSRVEWVKIFGNKFVKNMVVFYQQLILPEFLIIRDIFMLPNMDVMFCRERLHTISFNRHMHSFEVIILDTFTSVQHSSLADHSPLDLYGVNVNGIPKKFVRMKYDMADAEQ